VGEFESVDEKIVLSHSGQRSDFFRHAGQAMGH